MGLVREASDLYLWIMNKDLILRERLALQRTILANQSTFLSFLRTSMYFAVAGVSVDRLLDIPGGRIYAYGLFIIAAFVLALGVFNFAIHRKKIARSQKHIGDYKLEYGEEAD